METSDPTASRRKQIDRLIDASVKTTNPEANRGAAFILTLLEIADAIEGLAAEIEKSGWKKG